ncbi:MAG: TraR/DksA family transcriptional regulator [Planctomycetota bacterium]|jgi:RNA polymerase-binding transcription factor DksA
MPKPTKAEQRKFQALLERHLAVLSGDVGSMRDEALRASEQDSSVDHLADQGTDTYDQGFLLGLIENEEETIQLIEEALGRLRGENEQAYGLCTRCKELADSQKGKKTKSKAKIDPWIAKERLEYLPWAQYCVEHQSELEQDREIA